MFNIKLYQVKPTGMTEIEVEFVMWNRAPRTVKETYTRESDAKRRIDRFKTDYLLFTLESYVKACRDLIELNITPNTPGRLFALEKCKTGVQYLQDKHLTVIADTLNKLQPFLEKILPGPSHRDYDFLYTIQLRIHTFSIQTLNLKANELCPA
jgi:hypothetical protein